MRPRRRTVVVGLIVAATLLALLFSLSDASRLRDRLHELRWTWVAVAALVSVASYACIAQLQRTLLALAGHRLPRTVMLRASFVGVTVSRGMRSFGASGLAFLAWHLAPHGVRTAAVLAMGVGQVLVNNTVFALMLGVGLVLLAHDPAVAARSALTAYALTSAVIVVTLAVGWGSLLIPALRHLWERRAERAAGRIGRLIGRPQWGESAQHVVEDVARTSHDVLTGPWRMREAWGWALLRIATSLGALWACVVAVGVPLAPSSVILAYAVGKLAATVAIVPGGLGVVEGSETGALVMLGVPYEAALLAAVLNRVVYQGVPALVTLALAGPLLRRAGWRAAATSAGEAV